MITVPHNNYNNNEKFEILQELPKCDTETGSEEMLLEKRPQQTHVTRGCHKLSIWKK